MSGAAVIQDIRATPLEGLAASLHTRDLMVNGEDVLDHVIILRPHSDAARNALKVMLAMTKRGTGKPFIFALKDGGAEIVVRTKPHWEDA